MTPSKNKEDIFKSNSDNKLELDQHIESCKTEIIKIHLHSLINSLLSN